MRFVKYGLVVSIAVLMGVALSELRLMLGMPVSPLISWASNMTAVAFALVLTRWFDSRLRGQSPRWRE
jgi:putative flippase GtrA